jgi:hypothetical protein
LISADRYQADALHSPLTKAASGGDAPGVIAAVHAKIFSKKFTELFTTVQQCMGNVQADNETPRRLHQLLHDTVKHVVMRDEAYLAIMKQVRSSNPFFHPWPRGKFQPQLTGRNAALYPVRSAMEIQNLRPFLQTGRCPGRLLSLRSS